MKLYLLYVLLGCLSLTSLVLVHGQSKSGFISIDCGIPEDYTDTTSKIDYSSDAEFVNTGVNSNISTEYSTGNIDQQLVSLRSFPQGIRNCYVLRPEQGKNNNYFIRARFLYGNYDGENSLPMFDLYIGTNLWDRVLLVNESNELRKEITYEASTNYIQICLVKTGLGTPFISALELRHLSGSIYKSQTGCMVPYERNDLGSYGASGELSGYGDELGRLWSPYNMSLLPSERIDTYFPIDSQSNSEYKLPLQIMNDAAKPVNATGPLKYYWDQGGSATNFYVYLHFCELEKLKDNEVREFDILMNDVPWVQSVVPRYLNTITVTKEKPVSGGVSGELWMDLVMTNRSRLPPILNAMEIYIEKELSEPSTYPDDADTMVNISLIYGVKKNWQGDPCFPRNLSWEGVNCSYNGNNTTQITSLNLSSSGLTGEIAPALSSLKSLEYLDLSDNSLIGPMPQDLAQMPNLKILNLTNNNLTGSIPTLRVNSSLLLITEGNPNLCASCQQKNQKKKKNQIVVPTIASVASSLVVLTAIAVLWSLKMRRHKGRTLKSKNRRFTYSEVVSITNNFQTKIGKGGFGTVYLGHLEDGTEVAVKMLSRASSQGSEQFWTEAELLTTIHHKNLASLIGYCDQASNTALIYEYMSNGDLEEYLLDKNRTVLTWEQRLQIAIDAAQALEYLHNGCRPPIIHRDIKTANILLNEKLQAKVADFGLSRIFPFEDGTHISTAVVGTFGYLDPEYYITGRLTDKSDVYSFGIVILQLITGLPAIIKSEENTHIIQWVMPMIERGEISDIVDPRLEGDYDNNSAWKVLETAIACVPSSPIQRPTMSHVVGELKECLEIYLACGKALEMSQTTEMRRMRSSTAIDYLEPLDLESSMMCPQAR